MIATAVTMIAEATSVRDDGLMQQQPAEKTATTGINVGVGRHARRRAVFSSARQTRKSDERSIATR